VSGYYATYQSSLYPPAAIDFTAMTHLMVAGIIPNADGSLNTTFYIDAVNGPAMAKSLTTLAHAAGRKAVLMVGGSGALAGWEGASSAANRSVFVTNLLSTMTSLGFDGIDLDWEPVSVADEPALLALAQALRARAPTMILTVPVTWVSAYSGADPFYATLAPFVDQLNVMSYEMADAWPGWQSWYSGALAGQSVTTPTSVSSNATSYAAAGVPKSKIGIGIGFYGSCWTGVTGARQSVSAASVVASDNVMTYSHILADYYSAGAYQWDSVASVGSLSFPAAHGPEGCTWISYEDPASIAAKGAWIRANGYGGTILWTINEGYVATATTNPLLTAVKAAFLE
jgi:chitinase